MYKRQIYALSAYYEATKKKEALDEALSLFCLIEEKCTDDFGYLEAFSQKSSVHFSSIKQNKDKALSLIHIYRWKRTENH